MASLFEAEQEEAQRRFVEMLPEIRGRAQLTFRGLDPSSAEEAIAETVALSWANFVHCALTGKRVAASSLAHYAMLGVKSGRSLCGQNSKDVLARRTQLLGRATVESLDAIPTAAFADPTTPDGDSGWWDRSDMLEDRRTLERPFHRVRIKHDYGKFLSLSNVTEQEKMVFELLAEGWRTAEMAKVLKVSASRVCQVKSSIGEKLVGFFGPYIDPNHSSLNTPEAGAG